MTCLAGLKRPVFTAALVALCVVPVASATGELVSLYDNGSVLDDWGDPASQLSNTAPGEWRFIAAAADDFVLPTAASPGPNCQVTLVRAPFVFSGSQSGTAVPSLWEGIRVTVYANSALDRPDGQPGIDGGSSNSVVSQFVPAASLTYTTTGQHRPCFLVDVPVNFVLAKDTPYWLSLVPDYDAPPQTAWCLSSVTQTGFHAQAGASFGTPFWSEIQGNSHSWSGAPPASSNKDLAFQLFGVPEPATTAYLLVLIALMVRRRRA